MREEWILLCIGSCPRESTKYNGSALLGGFELCQTAEDMTMERAAIQAQAREQMQALPSTNKPSMIYH